MVLHKNKWDRKAKRAHERKLQAKAGASGTDGATSQESGNKSNISRKHGVLVGPKSADAGDGEHRLSEEEGESGEEEGGVKVETEDGAKGEGNKQDEDEAEEGEEKGKYSRRKIMDNSWRYEEPEEDPYLKAQNEEDEEPEPDYARMTIGKAQLKVSSDEEEEDEDFDQSALDEILIRDKPESKGPATKGKVVQVDRRQFQDIDEKVAKQKTAEAFRQRFAIRSKTKASPTNNFGVDNDNDADGDVDEFLEGLKLEARKPAQQSLRTTRISIAGGTGKGLRSEEQDDKWLDEMLGARPAGAKGRS